VTAQNPGGLEITGTYQGPADIDGFVYVEHTTPRFYDTRTHCGRFPAASLRAA
jgi:hypothetical protein